MIDRDEHDHADDCFICEGCECICDELTDQYFERQLDL